MLRTVVRGRCRDSGTMTTVYRNMDKLLGIGLSKKRCLVGSGGVANFS